MQRREETLGMNNKDVCHPSIHPCGGTSEIVPMQKVEQPFSNRINQCKHPNKMAQRSSLPGPAPLAPALASAKLGAALFNLVGLIRVDFPDLRGGAATSAGADAASLRGC
jgi:hypothetical protein